MIDAEAQKTLTNFKDNLLSIFKDNQDGKLDRSIALTAEELRVFVRELELLRQPQLTSKEWAMFANIHG